MINLPSVSIPITSYNQEKYIQATVLSALEQDYDNLDVIVCDDGSTDGTRDILSELSLKYPGRLRLHFNKTNLGGGKNRFQSLQLSQGEYIAYLDGDDILLPGKIRKQIDFMQSNPEFDFSYHNVEVFDSFTDGTIYYWKDRFGYGDGDIKKILRYGNYICTLSVLFKKDCVHALNYYPTIRVGQDWMVLFQILEQGTGCYGYIDEVLARYRRHDENRTLLWDDKLDSQLETLRIIGTHTPGFRPEIRLRSSEIYLSRFVYLLFNQKYKQAIVALWGSCHMAFPYIWKILRLPLREILFYFKTRGKMDDLLKELMKLNAS